MNIIEKIKEILMRFPKISEVVNDIHVDFTDDIPTNYGLSSTGDTILFEDVLGNQKRQHSFVLYSVWQSMNDYDRMSNSGVLLELAYWIEKQLDKPITKITTSNGMLYNIPNENTNDAWQYQIQIIVEYKI